MGEIEVENVVVDQAECKQGQGPLDDVDVQLVPAVSTLQPLADGERHRRPHDEEEEREDQVIECEPIPFRVLQLTVEGLRPGGVEKLEEGPEECVAPNDPERVEAPERID